MTRLWAWIRLGFSKVVSWKPIVIQFLREHPKMAVGVLIVLICYFVGSASYKSLLEEGQGYLSVGDFTNAELAFQKAADTNPIRKLLAVVDSATGDKFGKAVDAFDSLNLEIEADWGLKKTRVFKPAEKTVIETKLKNFSQEHPNDADVETFWGRFYLDNQNTDEAFKHFKNATQLSAKASYAHFGLCTVYELLGQIATAIAECKAAIDTANSIPYEYALNLAGLYEKQDNYENALAVLNDKRLDDTVSLKFERARVFQMKRDFKMAVGLYKEVLEALSATDPKWYFNKIVLATIDDKKCYVNLSQAAAYYLQGDANKVKALLSSSFCKQEAVIKISKQVMFDLGLIHDSKMAPKISEFNKLLLKKISTKP
ncbi:hypothetical protein BCS42_01755 [Crenothrix sp. D3]|nr:hypothetical protein BCS42_01755 [Crenothrix sp. D3]